MAASLPAALVSGALFGAGFMLVTGVLLIGSVAAFADRPAAGLAVTFLLIAAGQMAGAPVAGAAIAGYGATAAFAAFATVALIGTVFGPPGQAASAVNSRMPSRSHAAR